MLKGILINPVNIFVIWEMYIKSQREKKKKKKKKKEKKGKKEKKKKKKKKKSQRKELALKMYCFFVTEF